MLKLEVKEITYIISLLDFRRANMEVEKNIFNTKDYSEYERLLIKNIESKCNLIIKDYTKS